MQRCQTGGERGLLLEQGSIIPLSRLEPLCFAVWRVDIKTPTSEQRERTLVCARVTSQPLRPRFTFFLSINTMLELITFTHFATNDRRKTIRRSTTTCVSITFYVCVVYIRSKEDFSIVYSQLTFLFHFVVYILLCVRCCFIIYYFSFPHFLANMHATSWPLHSFLYSVFPS